MPTPAASRYAKPGSATTVSASVSEEAPLLQSRDQFALSIPFVDDGSDRPPSRQKPGSDDPAQPAVTRARGVGVGISLWILIFLQAANMSGMTIIQGTIAEDLDTYADVMWFSTSYLIALSSLGPVAARFADIFTPSSLVPPIALSLAAGSAVCAHAGSYSVFIVGRVISGVGASGVLSLAIITVLTMTDEKRRGLFIGLVNAGFTVGVSFGAIVFGVLLPAIGWRPLFWAQCPVSLLSGAALYFCMPRNLKAIDERTTAEKLTSIDYLGAGLLILTVVLLLYGLAGDIKVLPLGLSAVALLAFVVTEYRVSSPLISPKSLSSRGIIFSCFSQLGMMSARWTVLFYSPMWMLAVRGATPAAAGSILIPTNLGFILGGVIVGALHIKRSGSFWGACLVALTLFALSILALSFFTAPTASLTTFVVLVFLSGLATGATLNYTLAHLLHHSHHGTEYVTTSLLGTFRGFGGSFGTSVGGGIWIRALRSGLQRGFKELDGGDLSPDRRHLISRLLSTPNIVFGGELSFDERQVAINGYAGSARTVWQAAAVLGISVIVLQAATGWNGPDERLKEDGEAVAGVNVVAEDQRR